MNTPVSAPTLLDVINGRGQRVQRHPGNLTYRTLVSSNKERYTLCPRSDKLQLSKGIVAAVRELGGRFLELDERSGTYHDIGDKKAWAKTSQALREGQTKIRQRMHGKKRSAGRRSLRDSAAKATSAEEPPIYQTVSPCPSVGSEASNDADLQAGHFSEPSKANYETILPCPPLCSENANDYAEFETMPGLPLSRSREMHLINYYCEGLDYSCSGSGHFGYVDHIDYVEPVRQSAAV